MFGRRFAPTSAAAGTVKSGLKDVGIPLISPLETEADTVDEADAEARPSAAPAEVVVKLCAAVTLLSHRVTKRKKLKTVRGERNMSRFAGRGFSQPMAYAQRRAQ